jgi:NAD(P)-dependent dehydrogenase (short-subunit alcohol dehydrogenase family)
VWSRYALTTSIQPHPRPGEPRSTGADGAPGQPAEAAPVYVMLASDEASYVSGARVAVTGGKPIFSIDGAVIDKTGGMASDGE